jgi:multidrug efflux system membrane fusion protein
MPEDAFPIRKRWSPRLVLTGLGLLLLGFLGYRLSHPGQQGSTAPGAYGGRGNMAVTVTMVKVHIADAPMTLQAVGTIEAGESVSIQPRVAGQLMHVYFKQGDLVKAGQLLFEIDPSVNAAAAAQADSIVLQSQAAVRQAQESATGALAQVRSAQANLNRDQAQAIFAKAQEVRYRNLLAQNYVTREQYTQLKANADAAIATMNADKAAIANAHAQFQGATAAIQTAQATVQANRAALRAAQVQLDFSRIRSPLTGKTGPLLIYAGNIVQPNVSTLVTITRLSPVRAVFTVPEKYLPAIQTAMARQILGVTAVEGNDQNLSAVHNRQEKGRLVFVDNSVDASSGTVRLKGEFPNTDQALWPGRFVTVLLSLGLEKNMMQIPSKAVQTGQDGDFVFTVGPQQKAVMRHVVVSRIVNGQALVTSGLTPGDEVVVEGAGFLQPGKRVRLGRRKSQ